MILEIKRYGDYAKKLFWRKNKLNFLILYVTSKCNLTCGTCFFHKNLNKQNDLNFEKYAEIANSAGLFSILALAGGEPFLSPDLEKICAVFVEKCQIDTLFIPTNGTLTEVILEKTEKILKSFPRLSVSVNPSLDGMEKYHDQNRGVAGTFSRCIKTIEKLTELKNKYNNLQVIVNSVISKDNQSEILELMEFLKKYAIDFQAFELLRGDYRDKTLNLPSLTEIKKMHKAILKNRAWHLAKKKKVVKNSWLFQLEEIAVLGTLKYTQTFKELALAGKNWPCQCMAGRSIAVVNPDGNFSACEMRPPLANLKNYDYNITKLIKNKNIKIKNCACTHICFIHSAIAARPLSIIKIFLNYAKCYYSDL